MQFDPRFERTTQHLFLYLWFPPPLFFFSLPERYPPRAFSPFNSLPPLYCAACHNVYEYTNPLNFKIGQQNQNAEVNGKFLFRNRTRQKRKRTKEAARENTKFLFLNGDHVAMCPSRPKRNEEKQMPSC